MSSNSIVTEQEQQKQIESFIKSANESSTTESTKPIAKKSIHVDFSKRSKTECPFNKAKTTDKRLKLFLWGDFGSGKTTLALQFPNPAIIDLDGGSKHYGGNFNFGVLPANSADEAKEAVQWLLTNRHSYKTLIIDPITIYWDALQKKWSDIFLRRKKGTKGYKFEFYDLQPRDWMTIKAEFKDFIRSLTSLDMNVIVTARQKVQYADGDFMHVIGNTFDGEKSLPYLFDTIVQLYRDEKGNFLGKCLKDRSGRLPLGEFKTSFGLFEDLFGGKNLSRKVRPKAYVTNDQKQQLQDFIAVFGISEEKVAQRLAAYDADSLDDLTKENAELILEKFRSAAPKTNTTTNSNGKEA